MLECVVCGNSFEPSEMKRYMIRKTNERHLVCFCKGCHAAFQQGMKGSKRNPKVGRSVKKIVNALGTIGFVVMMAVFSAAMFAFKQIMKTKYGKEDSGGAGEPNFVNVEGSEKEPMLEDYSKEDLTGFQVSDESGTYPTDNLAKELYETDGTFSTNEVDFTDSNQTFSSEDSDLS